MYSYASRVTFDAILNSKIAKNIYELDKIVPILFSVNKRFVNLNNISESFIEGKEFVLL